MATTAFIIFWVVLGVGLLLLALRGGRSQSAHGPVRSRRLPRTWTVGFLLALVVLGVAVPAAVVAGVFSDTSVPDANIASLTEQEERGRELFAQRCRNCHSLDASNASAAVGPDLDELRPPAELVLNAIEEGRSRGNGQMPPDLVEGEDAEAVAAWVAKATGAAE